MAKKVHPTKKSRFHLSVMVAVLLLALTLGSVAQAAPTAQGRIVKDVIYGLNLNPQEAKLCVGQTVVFVVSVRLIVTEQLDNQAPYDYRVYYSNEDVTASVQNTNVGSIDPTSLRTSVALDGGYDPNDVAPLLRPLQHRINRRGTHSPLLLGFAFTAEESGVTTIRFEHTRSAKNLTRALPLTAQVEVVDCWEAYATGLWTGNKENNWTKKDICSLERPFVLEGNGVTEAGEARTVADSKAFFFWPMAEPFGVAGVSALQHGRYIYVGLSTVIGLGMQSSCTSVGSGSYEQFIYDSRFPREGNLILFGSVDKYCEGFAYHTDNEAIQVAFRALGAGLTCQESLPGLNP